MEARTKEKRRNHMMNSPSDHPLSDLLLLPGPPTNVRLLRDTLDLNQHGPMCPFKHGTNAQKQVIRVSVWTHSYHLRRQPAESKKAKSDLVSTERLHLFQLDFSGHSPWASPHVYLKGSSIEASLPAVGFAEFPEVNVWEPSCQFLSLSMPCYGEVKLGYKWLAAL